VLLAIDFIDGDGPSNSVGISQITTDGTSILESSIGGVTIASGGYQLYDSSFYNSVSVKFSGASYLSFLLNPTNQPPLSNGFEDMLGLYLLDSTTGIPVFFTDEPLGTQALISWAASGNGNGDLLIYNTIDPSNISWKATFLNQQPNPIPEPATMSLFAIGVVGLIISIRREEEK
jgi:hypothetical protein